MTRRKRATVSTDAIVERKVGRSEPPQFMFQLLRPPILEMLQDSSGLLNKVVCIVAPVGYGKTAVMSLLLADLRSKGRQCRWLGLDQRDTSIEDVLGSLVSLIDVRTSEQQPAQALFQSNRSIERRIDALIEIITGYPLPITLFIDNLNACNDPELGLLLDKLIFSSPPSLQLILSSTQELPFDLARARLAGLIRPVGLAELAFGAGEVGLVLGEKICTHIGTSGLSEVLRHTEGWPAAVRMAQIILDNAPQPKLALAQFTGADEGVAQLLNRQVLSGFPLPVRSFLLHVAQLPMFCIDLCAYAMDDPNVGSHLSYLMQRNAFVIPLDNNRHWYRLHGLFKEFLIGEAEHSLTAAARTSVQKRAAVWCESNGYWRECVDYALAAKQTRITVRVLERIAERSVRDEGNILQYIRWMEALHERGNLAGPEAEYWFAWALSFCRRYEEARQRCTMLIQRIHEDSRGKLRDTKKTAALLRQIEILLPSLDSLTDRIHEAHKGAEKWLAEADGVSDAAFNVTNGTCIESCYFTNQFDFVRARQSAQAARQAAFQTKSAYVSGWVSAYAAIIPVYEGDFSSAYQEVGMALATTRATLGESANICGTLALIGAKCAVEMGIDGEAKQLLVNGLASPQTHGFLEGVGCGLEAATLLWTGLDNDAVSPTSLREVAACYPPRLSLMLECYLIRQMIRLGRKDEAGSLAARIGLTTKRGVKSISILQANAVAHLSELVQATQIDLLLARNRLAQAEALITEQIRKANQNSRMARLVELDLSMTALAVRSGRTSLAIRHFTRAVSVATPRRIVRPFDEKSKIISALISDKTFSGTSFVSREELRFFNEICQRCGIDLFKHQLEIQKDAQPRLLNELTPRERELLQLIDIGLTNRELADRTSLTLTTVKWHLHNLFVKLGASRRAAALAKARALRLIA